MAEQRKNNGSGPRSPLAALASWTSKAHQTDPAGVVMRECALGTAIEVTATRGQSGAVAAALKSALGVDAPMTPRCGRTRDVGILWSGPGRWLVLADASRAEALLATVTDATRNAAAIVDQSHARLQISLSGPRACATLEKLVGIDVRQESFAVGAAAMTGIAHIPVHLWREAEVGGHPEFQIAGPQSYAESLWHHVQQAAAEFGLESLPIGE